MEPPRTFIPVAALVLVVAMLGQRPGASERSTDSPGKASTQKHETAPATAKAKGPSSASSATDVPNKALAFVLRLAIFVLIPLLTLFAAQFPDTGGVLMRWLEPVRKFLP
jgi:hypothetical protein